MSWFYKLAAFLLALFFIINLYFTFSALNSLEIQADVEKNSISEKAKAVSKDFDELIKTWAKTKLNAPIPTLEESFENMECGLMDGESYFPSSHLWKTNRINEYLTEEKQIDVSKLNKLGKEQFVDPLLIRLWIKHKYKDEVEHKKKQMQTLTNLALKHKFDKSPQIHLKQRVLTFKQVLNEQSVTRAIAIPDAFFKKLQQDAHVKWLPDVSKGEGQVMFISAQAEVLNKTNQIIDHQDTIHGLVYAWKLSPLGHERIKQISGKESLYVSLTMNIFIILLGVLLLIKINREIREQTRIKENLVSNISHELRTPIATIQLYSELLNRYRNVDERKFEKYLRNIENESKHLSKLIENFLDFSKLSKGKMELEQKPNSLKDMFFELEEQVESIDKKKQLHIDIPDGIFIIVDRCSFIQVMLNLVTNSLKYAPEGKIEITCHQQGKNTMLIRVEDEGPGIANEDQIKIFDSFYRGSKAKDDQTPGHGLGLSIAKSLTQSMNGNLVYREVKSGACFEATFAMET